MDNVEYVGSAVSEKIQLNHSEADIVQIEKV